MIQSLAIFRVLKEQYLLQFWQLQNNIRFCKIYQMSFSLVLILDLFTLKLEAEVTKKETAIVKNEIAQTYELYGFEMSYSEFEDIFRLGAEFGYQLAVMKKSQEAPKMLTPFMIFKKKRDSILNKKW